ncbi:MAG: peptide chain release factor N(5)-glutamine methyltransferase [Bacteroidales bacterium]|nr:peptide chain release factor N(5)-glutamine methyltransferase [Bacteroidales bacterium]
MTLSQLYSLLKSQLSDFFTNQNENIAVSRQIIKHITGYSSSDIVLKSDIEINIDNNFINNIIARIKKSEPLEYIFNNAQFLDLELFTESSVLIPRPETEELVIKISNFLKNKNNFNILDIGTGSGCIPIYLAINNPKNNYFACDISEKAIFTATKNANKYNLNNINIFLADILNYQNNKILTSTKFDVIVSNPPYVTNSEKTLMKSNVLNFEPHNALFVSDNDPLLFYIKITEFATKYLNQNGKLYFEINERFGSETYSMMKQFGLKKIIIHKDLFGKERMIEADI